jgi:hypothetical protein
VNAANTEPIKNGGPESDKHSAAGHLVQEALAAELKGDNDRRDELLAQALTEDPNCRAARWQSGYVEVDGKWITVAEAAEKFAADANLAEYRRRRDQAASAGLFTRGSSDTAGGGTSVGATVARGSSAEIHRGNVLSLSGLAAEAELARWCRTKTLSDEERAHWTQVLLDDPSNAEAESRLGMKVFMGHLTTFAQIDAAKKQHAVEEKQLSDWKATVSRWRKMLDAGSETERAQAADEMAQRSVPAMIPALEWAVFSDAPNPKAKSDSATRFQREAMSLLGHLSEQRASYSLAGYSVLAPQAELRKLAAAQLKSRPLHDWVPLLLVGLANPIQFDYAMAFDPTIGVAVYHAAASQDAADAVHKIDYSSSASGLRPGMNGTRNVGDHQTTSIDYTGKNPTTTQNIHWDIANVHITTGPQDLRQVPGAAALARQSRNLVVSLTNENERIRQTNERINYVLEQVAPPPKAPLTGAANDAVVAKTDSVAKAPASSDPVADDGQSDESDVIPGAPKADSPPATPSTANYWWNWWADYNESHASSKPVLSESYSDNYDLRNQDQVTTTYANGSQTNVYNLPPPPPPLPRGWHYDIPGTNVHCFAAGTPVVTATGPVAIERVQIGDRVLSQDPTTGELAFKPVLATSKNPPVKLLRVSTPRGDVRLTLGHPFWIEGKGWRMAKELAVGDKIHGLGGAVGVTRIEKAPDDPVYNLGVADFGTFFIGDAQLLVHDASIRLPTRMLVPGYAAAGNEVAGLRPQKSLLDHLEFSIMADGKVFP